MLTVSHFVHYDTLLQNETDTVLQNTRKFYQKMRQVFHYNMRQFYYKMRQLLQHATFITSDVYYKMRRYNHQVCIVFMNVHSLLNN